MWRLIGRIAEGAYLWASIGFAALCVVGFIALLVLGPGN